VHGTVSMTLQVGRVEYSGGSEDRGHEVGREGFHQAAYQMFCGRGCSGRLPIDGSVNGV
jgi:hypothetical protein